MHHLEHLNRSRTTSISRVMEKYLISSTYTHNTSQHKQTTLAAVLSDRKYMWAASTAHNKKWNTRMGEKSQVNSDDNFDWAYTHFFSLRCIFAALLLTVLSESGINLVTFISRNHIKNHHKLSASELNDISRQVKLHTRLPLTTLERSIGSSTMKKFHRISGAFFLLRTKLYQTITCSLYCMHQPRGRDLEIFYTLTKPRITT